MPSPTLTLGSFLVAIMVGLTGMGGGALLTPMLMLVFGVPPLAAVSSDLVVSAITKPVGALVHLRRGTVNLRLAGWLSIGSVPSAFLGGLLGWWLGPGSTVQTVTARTTGVVLLAAAAGVTAKTVLIPALRGGGRTATRSQRATGTAGTGAPGASALAAGAPATGGPATGGPATGGTSLAPASPGPASPGAASPGPASPGPASPAAASQQEQQDKASGDVTVRKIPTLLIGIVVGLAVGVTSTGSGTLVLAALATLYPALPAGRLVGTDLAQAVPMVLAAALAHIVAGDVQMSVTTPLLAGGLPGVVIGSLLASRAPGGLLRPVLGVVVLASGLSLLGLSPQTLVVTVGVAVVILAVTASRARLRRHWSQSSHRHPGSRQRQDSRRQQDGRPRAGGQQSRLPRQDRAGNWTAADFDLTPVPTYRPARLAGPPRLAGRPG